MSRTNFSSNDIFSALGGGYGASVESIVTKEITKIISSAMCGKNLRELFENLFGKMWKVAILFGVSYFMKNINKVGNVLSLILRITIYKKMEVNLKNSESIEFLFHKKMDSFMCTGAEDSKVQPVNGLKIYQRKMDGKVQIEYIPILHSSFIDARKIEAEESVKEFENLKEVYINCIGSKKKPVEKYESKNFKAAAKIIDEFFKVRKCRNSFNSQAIVIDGPPGLGKTDFLNHVAWKKLSDFVIYANLTKDEYMKQDFNYVVDKIYSISVTGTCVIHIDEIDKYLSHRIKTKYDELFYKSKEDVGKRKMDDKKLEPSEGETESPHSPPIIQPFEEFERKEKEVFLYKLLHLIETDKFNDGVVIILTSNNFDSIFENVDMRHFQSMKRRFLRVRFEECDLEDFVGYCRFYNDSFKTSYPEKYIPEDLFEEYVRKINPSLKIPFWHIHQGMIASSFCIPELIDVINSYSPEEEPIFSLDVKPPSPSGNGFIKRELHSPPPSPQPHQATTTIKPPPPSSPKRKEKFSDDEWSDDEDEEPELVKCELCDNLTDFKSSSVCVECNNNDEDPKRGVLCSNCDEKCSYCEDCGSTWCPTHWKEVSCENCNTHQHGKNKRCICKCVICNDIITGEMIFDACDLCHGKVCEKEDCKKLLRKCSCGLMCCDDCLDSKGRCIVCIRNSDQESNKLEESLKNIPQCEVNVNYLAELKEYELGEDAYEKLSLEHVQLANRIFQCTNPVDAITAYLMVVGSIRKNIQGKIYFVCKIFEYALKEEFEVLIRKYERFRVTFFNKMEEFEDDHNINKNMKYIDISSRVRTKYSFEYQEWLNLKKGEKEEE